MLPPGSIWSTGQLIGLGYRKTLGEAVCPPPPLRVYQGPSLLQLSNDTKPGPGINTPVTSFPPPLDVFAQSGNWALNGKLGSTLAVLSEVHRHRHICPFFHPYCLS